MVLRCHKLVDVRSRGSQIRKYDLAPNETFVRVMNNVIYYTKLDISRAKNFINKA